MWRLPRLQTCSLIISVGCRARGIPNLLQSDCFEKRRVSVGATANVIVISRMQPWNYEASALTMVVFPLRFSGFAGTSVALPGCGGISRLVRDRERNTYYRQYWYRFWESRSLAT